MLELDRAEAHGSRCGPGSCSGCWRSRPSGLVTAELVTYTSLRSFLLDRVDAGLEADHQGAAAT